jgi:phosphate transport system substrate-binding protein
MEVRVRITRGHTLAAVACAGVLALSACSESDNGDSGADGGTASIDCASGTLSGEGSSFQKNAITEWAKVYQQACPDATINYNATGSGAGISQFIANQVDWAGSDSALKDDEVADAAARCNDNEAWNLPMVSGAIGVTYNVEGLDALVLTPDVIAQIFLGEVTDWDDAAIADLNPDAALPSEAITVFFRADESGTTDNFTKYLNAAAPSVWTAEPGKAWPTGAAGEGKGQSAGILEAVSANENSISYLDFSDVQAAGLSAAAIDNGGGPVDLTAETAAAAIGQATNVGEGNDIRLEFDYSTTEGYPIVAVAYEIVCSAGLDADKTELLKSYLAYTASPDGQAELERIGFVPLPESVESNVATAVAAIQ